MHPLVVAAILIVLGFLVVGLELFVPSAGLLAILAALLIVGGIVAAFFYTLTAGAIVLAITCFSLPLIFAAALKIWPNTPIGRRILIGAMTEEDVLPQSDLQDPLKPLIGRRGVAKTKMLPSGIVQIDDRNYDAISDGYAIEPRSHVEVISVRTKRLVVRPVDPNEAPSAHPDDILSRPIDQLGIDPIDEA
jgi:membrane-bound serine protease (ClpP class)